MPSKNLLSKYNKKRDFKKTAEPAGKLKKGKGFGYLIQKHDATRLHYDFRLELDGVLKSWAVTKGPSLDPADKRLAVEVEDHPVSYGTFEGTIPEGQYGGGTVMLWDNGTWEPLDDPHKGLKKGHLHFKLYGGRLKGEWALVRMNPRPQDKGRSNWLLLKKSDQYAKPGDKDKFLLKENTSITTKRSMEEIAESKKSKVWQSNREEKKEKVKPIIKTKLPAFIPPQLATLVDKMPEGKNWVHEIKFDGYRTLARIDDSVRMQTRTGLDWTHKFKAIARELKKLNKTAILDGEIVALNKGGQSSFMELQKALTDKKTDELQYYVFDLLYLDGKDLRDLSLTDRKEKLKALLENKKLHNIFYSDHFTKAEGFYDKACKLGLEGVISKKADEKYHSGRGKYWLKSKCHKRQEFVIGGFTMPSTGANGVGALLLGYYKNGKLTYSSKCGTGFDNEMSSILRKKLEALKTKENPFEKVTAIGRRGAIWVKPKLVCEIEFTEWTTDGALRHPSFQGLREDKPATHVGRDKEKKIKTVKTNIVKPKTTKAVVAGINISHPDRILYPNENITKLEVAEYYEAISNYILPYIKDRPISTIRCQDDITKECFFQRHAGTSNNKYLHEVRVNNHGGGLPYMAVNSREGLISLIQNGIVEIHPWGATSKDITKPDRIIFDFDPDVELDWKLVVEAAFTMKKKLEKLGLKSFLKTTGGKGLHVTVPIKPKYGWHIIKPFAKALAESMVKDEPKKYTANMSKASRKGKIFIDYLRNGETATAISAYALRARAGATVAMPMDWKEITPKLDPKKFNLRTVPAILKKRSDPWKDFYKTNQQITAVMLKTFKIKT